MNDLKPLHAIVTPGVTCEVQYLSDPGNPNNVVTAQWDGYELRFCAVPQKFTAECLKPNWRLVPPAPLLKWEPDPEAFVAGEYLVRNTRDGSKCPWLVQHVGKVNGRETWFPTRAECEQWAESHARSNR